MRIEFVTVTDSAGREAVARLADSIWNQHFPAIIGQAQVDYMLEKFQSPAAIKRQIKAGCDYYIISARGKDVGYFAIEHDPAGQAVKLSKIYIDNGARGQGYGTTTLQFIEELCRARQCERLWLTVNKDNHASIAFYEARGFRREKELVADIGSGFVMDDYIMEKRLIP